MDNDNPYLQAGGQQDNPYLKAGGQSNPYMSAAPQPQPNPQGNARSDFPALGGVPPNASGTPPGQQATAGWYDRLPGAAKEVVGQAGPAMQALGQAAASGPSVNPATGIVAGEEDQGPAARLGRYMAKLPSDYLTNKIGQGLEKGASAIENFLTKPIGIPGPIPEPQALGKAVQPAIHGVLSYLLSGDVGMHGETAHIPEKGAALGGPMDLVKKVESGDRNVPQRIIDINTAKGTPAQGYYQIIDPTWRRYAPPEVLARYKSAIEAPQSVQDAVAARIPVKEWGPNTIQALRFRFPEIDINKPLGEAQKEFGGLAPRAETFGLGAQRTPTHELLADNLRRFEEENRSDGIINRLDDVVSRAQDYYKTGEEAKGIIQENVGEEARTAAQAGAAMDRFRQFTSELNQEEQLDLLKWMQNPASKLGKLSPDMQRFTNTFKEWMQTYRSKLEALPQTEKMQFRDNFVTQLWKNPKDAMSYIHDYGAKQGSNYFTKAHVFDDYEAGIRAGKVPVTTDPMELFARYIENASAKIASWQTLNAAKDRGLIVSRNPLKDNVPEGWMPVKGFTPPNYGEIYFAPGGAAKVFNNYMSRPPTGMLGKGLDWAQKAANATTAFKLAISGFHATLETGESVISSIANAIDKIMGGHVLSGVIELGKAPIKPITSMKAGRDFQKAYLNGEFGSPQMQKIVEALTKANYDPMRQGKLADEYRVSRFPGFFKSIERGRLRSELRELNKLPRAKAIANLGFRAFETAMEPVFQYYIPFLKNSAALDMMKTYLQQHPNAEMRELAGYARQVTNTIDNRFGEMNQNNLFWHVTAKKMFRAALISYSYTLGTARLAGGAFADLASVPSKAAYKIAGKLPANEQIWSHRLSYAIAMGLGVVMADSTYQYLKTGQLPQDAQDLIRPRTGGTDPSTGQPERAVVPMFFNAFRNFWLGPRQEAYNKLNPLIHTIVELSSNEDWKKQPIYDGNEPVTKQIEQAARYTADELGTPITLNQQTQAKEGTHIGSLERLFGIRAAGMRDTAPQKLQQIISYKTAEAWFEKRKSDINAMRSQQGKPPLRLHYRDKTRIINAYMKNPQTDPLSHYASPSN